MTDNNPASSRKKTGSKRKLFRTADVESTEGQVDPYSADLQALFDTMTEGIALNEVICDEKGDIVDYRILYVNKAFFETADFSGAQVVGNLATNLYGFDQEYIRSYWRKNRTNKTTVTTELESPINKKTYIIKTSPLTDGKFITTFQDVTESLQIRKILEESEARYRELFENASQAIFQSKVDGEIITVNPGFARLFGYESPEEFLSLVKDASEVFADPRRRAEVIQLRSQNPELGDFENLYRRKDGSTFIGLLNFRTVTDPEGKPLYFNGSITDITGRKRSERALQESERRYRAVFEGVEDAIFIESLDGRILDVNQRACDMYGYTYEQFLTKTVNDLVPSRDKIVPFDSITAGAILEPTPPVETANMRANGEYFPVELSIRTQELNGELVLFVVVRDISGRKRAEEALRESEAKFRTLVENSNDGIIFTGADGTIHYRSPSYVHINGFSDPERVGHSAFETIHPEDVDAVRQFWTQLAQNPGLTLKAEYRIRHKAGHWIWIETTAQNLLDQPDIHEIVVNSRDITERKLAQEALRESEEKFSRAFQNGPMLMTINEVETGQFIEVNAEALRVSGFTREELVGKTSLEVGWMTPEQRTRMLEIVKADGRVKGMELTMHDKWGKMVHLLYSNEIITIGGKPYIIAIAEDITQRKQAQEALSRQAEELQQRNDELARLYRASGSLLTESPFDLSMLARSILNTVIDEFGQTNSSLFLIDVDTKRLIRLAAVGPYAEQVMKVDLALDGPGLVPQSIRTGQSINTPDVRSDAMYFPAWEKSRSELTIPLKIGDRVIGVIDIQSTKVNAFTASDERLMTIFSERAALALEHARLYAQTEQRLENLSALRIIDMAISSSFDIHFTLNILIDQILNLMKIHAVDILIANPATQNLRYLVGQGFRTKALQQTDLRFGEGFAGQAAHDRQAIVIQGLAKNSGALARSAYLSRESFSTYIGVPLISKGQVKGVLELFQREPLELTSEQHDFLDTLAGQAAIAIDNAQLFESLQGTNSELMLAYEETIEGWAQALDLRDKETEGHSRRVSEMAVRLAEKLGSNAEELVHIRRGALLHDIGKLGVPDDILFKQGPLTDEEWASMKKHPKFAYDMLAPITYLHPAIDIPYCHHEKWDGSGYPRGLKEYQIPMAARIFAVIDVWDALISDRPYRKAWTKEKALAYIQEHAGKHFDPRVVVEFIQEVS